MSQVRAIKKLAKVEELKKRVRDLEGQLALEEARRIAAQRGLVPYVRAAQQLGEWAREATPDLIPKLRELGLWDVAGDCPLRLGYDPDQAIA